jgi:hypothetical protein
MGFMVSGASFEMLWVFVGVAGTVNTLLGHYPEPPPGRSEAEEDRIA